MSELQTNHSTLRDYLAVLRRRWRPLLGVVVLGVLLAVGLAASKKDTFTADASIRFRDVAESFARVGLVLPQGELPAQISAQGAETVTDAEVLEDVLKRLGLQNTTVDALEKRVTATQEPKSNLVTITAEAESADEASRLSNAVADAATTVLNRDVRDRFGRLSDELEQQAKDIRIPEGKATDLSNEKRSEIQARLSQRQDLLELSTKYKALSISADVAEVATRARPPAAANNMSPVGAGILGGFLALILSLIIIGVLESLDRRLHSIDDAQAATEKPMIGVVLEEGLGKLPVGAKPGEEEVAAMNAYQLLRTNINFLDVDRETKVVLVTSSLAEEGKTTVSMGLALAAAGRSRVLLVEADLQRHGHARLLGLNSRPGLSDYLSGNATPQEVLQKYQFTNPVQAMLNGGTSTASTLACVTAGSPTAWAAELLRSERFGEFIASVREAYDLVIVDTAPLLGVADTAHILPHADAVAFCARLNQTTSEQLLGGLEALSRLPPKPTGLVVTGVRSSDHGYYTYSYNYGVGHAGAAA
jgi:non-specific protein-tyrosine kinase